MNEILIVFKSFLRTRIQKLQDAYDVLCTRTLQRDNAVFAVQHAQKVLEKIQDEADLAEARYLNSLSELKRCKRYWAGPQSLNWFSKKRNFSYQEMKGYLDSVVDPELDEVRRQVQFCIDHPGDNEYAEWEEKEGRIDSDETSG